MLQPYGYYDKEVYYAGDACPECVCGTMMQYCGGELVCSDCGLALKIQINSSPELNREGWGIAKNGRLVNIDQYETVNIFSGQPEGTVGTPAMNLRSTEDGRISATKWLEQHSKNTL